MEEEIILKQKYNDLLKSLKKGQEFIEKNPNDEKAQKRLGEIGDEMQNIIKNFPNITVEEMENGFVIEPIENPKETVEVSQETEKSIVKVEEINHNNSLEIFSNNWKIASQLSKSTIIPDNYRGKPENVIIALGLANQMNLDPFTVMQNLAIIKGKTSWSGSFCKTLIERTGKYKNLELNYIGEKGKDTYGCYLSAVRVSDGKLIKGPEVTMKMAKEENWITNKKWLTLTDLMLAYRCQSFFCRLYVPEAMNGIYTIEEIEDTTEQRQKPIDIL